MDVLDQIKEAVNETWLAKSRKTNKMSETEQAALLTKLEEVIKPLLEEEVPKPSENGNGNGKEPSWVGTSEGDDLEITADKKSDILDAWIAEFGLDPEKVLSTKVGFAYFYVYPNQDGTSHELWIKKAA